MQALVEISAPNQQINHLFRDGHSRVKRAFMQHNARGSSECACISKAQYLHLQIVHTGAKKDRMKAKPLVHPVRFSNPVKVYAAVLSSPRRAMGSPMTVTRINSTLRMTLGV